MRVIRRHWPASHRKQCVCACPRATGLSQGVGILTSAGRASFSRQHRLAYLRVGSKARTSAKRSSLSTSRSCSAFLEQERLQDGQAHWKGQNRDVLNERTREGSWNPRRAFEELSTRKGNAKTGLLEDFLTEGKLSSVQPSVEREGAHLEMRAQSLTLEHSDVNETSSEDQAEACNSASSSRAHSKGVNAEQSLSGQSYEDSRNGRTYSNVQSSENVGASRPLLEPGGPLLSAESLSQLLLLDGESLAAIKSTDLDRAGREQLRRARISAANAGKRSWNTGQKHSEETKALISLRTKEAMRRPDIALKVRKSVRVTRHSEATKEKIKQKSQQYHSRRRAGLRFPTLGNCLKTGKYNFQDLGDRAIECIANLLPPPLGIVRSLEEHATANSLLESFSAEAVLNLKASFRSLTSRKAGLQDVSAVARKPTTMKHGAWVQASLPPTVSAAMLERAALRGTRQRPLEHRAAISEAIRRKWADPGYRERIRMAKSEASSANGKAKRIRSPSLASKKGSPASRAQKLPGVRKVGRPRKVEPLEPSVHTEELMAMERNFLEQSRLRQAKLQNARKLVAEMEHSLAHFADLDIEEEAPEVQQSVSEAHELLKRGKQQVQKLEAEAMQEQQFAALSRPVAPSLDFGSVQRGNGQNEAFTGQIEDAMLTINLD